MDNTDYQISNKRTKKNRLVSCRQLERSGLQTRIATTESVSLCTVTKKLTAFMELEVAVRNRQSTPATEKQERDSPPEIALVS
jgi:hypothetical protein